jgi:hypothetical protein
MATVIALGSARTVTAQTADAPTWSLSATAYTYILPADGNYVQPTFTADRRWLHLEARYNYEALSTGSVWGGYNFSGGDRLAWEFTPKLGAVFGEATGEHVFATDSADSFFYNWSELTLAPIEQFRFGLVTQRTRAYESDREIQRGLVVATGYRRLELSAYVFNPDDEEPTFVFAVGLSL